MSESKVEYATIHMYAAREEIYPREVKGRFANWRWACVVLTQLVFYGLPWLEWGGRQAVLFDLAARKFYIFGIVLWPQDFIYLAALLIICAFSLFLFTAVAGRLWCGFACPQTVYTEIFLWIERKIEGNRSARMRLDKQPLNGGKLARKSTKHLAWLAIALWTGVSFVGYFTPVKDLLKEILVLDLGPWEWFWVLFYSIATYGNAGWMREQVCKYMCPYARFQSAMFDSDTLIISYDQHRGEPRSPKNAKQRNGPDCIDCSLCVQVCPTGIDIRKGLQYECIGCAGCIDACDSVMDKIGAPRGLIRYSTSRAMKSGLNLKEIKQHVFRPRVLIYAALLLLIASATMTSLLMRTPLKLDVIRDRGAMGREVEDGMIENVYRLQIMNTDMQAHHYTLTVEGISGAKIVDQGNIELQGASNQAVPIRVRISHGAGKPGSNRIWFILSAVDVPKQSVKEKAVFFVPR